MTGQRVDVAVGELRGKPRLMMTISVEATIALTQMAILAVGERRGRHQDAVEHVIVVESVRRGFYR